MAPGAALPLAILGIGILILSAFGLSRLVQALAPEAAQQPVNPVWTPPAIINAPTLDGGTVSLDDYKGRVLLLDFWATWCGPCIAELPNVKRVYEKFHGDGFDILSISLDRDKSTLRRFVERQGLEWTHIYNGDLRPGKDPASIYGVQAIPTMILIGRDGKVAATDVRGRRIEVEVARALRAKAEDGNLDRVIGRSRGPQRPKLGILDKTAPAWPVDQWFNLPAGRTSIDVGDYRGKVVYLYGFQSWCPGCHAYGFPTLQELIKRFKDDDDVAFVAIQTTFEGFNTNTPDKALATAQRYGLSIPVGHSGSNGNPSRLMRDYRGGGTPWTVIIDRNGVVRFNDFHITPDQAERLINVLRTGTTAEASTPSATGRVITTLPANRGGQDRIGTEFPDVQFDRWIRRGGPNLPDDGPRAEPASLARPRATLYRWWTDTCPFCESSLPAVELLRTKYAQHGLRTVAVYHPKPPRHVPDEEIAAAAQRLGYHGDIAVDLDWSALREAYLRSGRRFATSVTFIVDKDGVTRFLHPGPEFFPSNNPAHAQAEEDFGLIESAIRVLLNVDAASITPSSDR